MNLSSPDFKSYTHRFLIPELQPLYMMKIQLDINHMHKIRELMILTYPFLI